MSGDGISMRTKADRPLLSVRDLRVSFGASQIAAVKSISFDVYADETIAIVGESGSGKSVTALAIMRLLDARRSRTEGSIEFLGTDLLGLSPKGMRAKRGKEISMVFQEPMTSLNPLLSVGRQISEVLTQHNGISHAEASKEAARLLDRVRIPSAKARLNDYPHQFSGGMRQRVMIASAIARRPRLLIADEPTTALDVTIQAQVLELLRELQTEYAMTVMFITHDMGVVAEVADRTMVMYRGDLVETAETTALFATQHHPYTRSLLLSVPKLGSMSKHASPQRLPIVDPVNGDITIPESSGAVPARDEPPVLEVKNLSVRFDVRSGVFNRMSGRVHAVENVSFELLKGETLAVVGESGSGKSTTGRAIIKLVGADEGRIILQGEDINTLTPAKFMQKRRKIQMIFQDPLASLDPRQTIVEAVVEPILVHRLMNRQDARLKAIDLFEKVGLQPHLADRYPHQLSGGQRQRVCIARALGLDPQVIIADEAVSALDVSVRAQVINLMIKLQEELGLSYLFISHDMAVVERISHRVAVMYLGEIVEIGPRTSIFGNPQHPYTRKLIAAVPIPDPSRRGERIPTEVEQLRSPVRQLDHVLQTRPMCEVSDGHFVQR